MTKVIYYELLWITQPSVEEIQLADFYDDGGCPWRGLTSEDLLSASASLCARPNGSEDAGRPRGL